MVRAVKSVISQRGTIDTDDRTNSIVIRDTPEHIEKVQGLVKTLDKQTDQIKIEAKLLEIESGALTELGLNWSMVSRRSAQLLDGDKAEATFSQLTDRVSDPSATYTFATVHGDFDFEGTISALVSDSKGKIIAHPEITTVDNREAFIQMGQRIPIKQFDEAGNVVIEFEEVGTILRVTPHITSENRILLKLRPERSSYTFDANGVLDNSGGNEEPGRTTHIERHSYLGLSFPIYSKTDNQSGLSDLCDSDHS
jgi:type IV pilus assembly protein PilQ